MVKSTNALTQGTNSNRRYDIVCVPRVRREVLSNNVPTLLHYRGI